MKGKQGSNLQAKAVESGELEFNSLLILTEILNCLEFLWLSLENENVHIAHIAVMKNN